ncbi:MAG TPA: ABC transporter permease [Chloroflexia bacterium]|nr:ABC transporter permease [Chloroflexia bacterium]
MAAIAQVHESPVSASLDRSEAAAIWRRFRRHKMGIAGLIILSILGLAALIIPAISPYSYRDVNPLIPFAPANTMDPVRGIPHLFGTDYLGRDVFTRLFYGERTSLFVSIFATIFIVIIGVVTGAIAGFYGGWVDTVLMRFTDFMLALPLLPVYLFANKLFRPTTITPEDAFPVTMNLALIFVLFGWMGMSRLVRGSFLSLRTEAYVEASKALGASNRRLIFRHLLPNSIAPVLVAATFSVGDFIIWECVLAYFGQGVTDFIVPSLGNMVVTAQVFVWNMDVLNPFEGIKAYLLIIPGTMIFLTVLSINYVGDALRNALDPHQTN